MTRNRFRIAGCVIKTIISALGFPTYLGGSDLPKSEPLLIYVQRGVAYAKG